MRSGVPTRPSRAGSSPAQRIKTRTACSTSVWLGRDGRSGVAERGSAADKEGAKLRGMSALSFMTEAGCPPEADANVPRARAVMRSVQADRLVRTVQRKGRDADPKTLAG